MNEFAACPKCGSTNAKELKFTWWGGVVGAKMLSHVKCENCGAKYNGKTGKYNTTGIAVYMLVATILAAVFYYLFFAYLMPAMF